MQEKEDKLKKKLGSSVTLTSGKKASISSPMSRKALLLNSSRVSTTARAQSKNAGVPDESVAMSTEKVVEPSVVEMDVEPAVPKSAETAMATKAEGRAQELLEQQSSMAVSTTISTPVAKVSQSVPKGESNPQFEASQHRNEKRDWVESKAQPSSRQEAHAEASRSQVDPLTTQPHRSVKLAAWWRMMPYGVLVSIRTASPKSGGGAQPNGAENRSRAYSPSQPTGSRGASTVRSSRGYSPSSPTEKSPRRDASRYRGDHRRSVGFDRGRGRSNGDYGKNVGYGGSGDRFSGGPRSGDGNGYRMDSRSSYQYHGNYGDGRKNSSPRFVGGGRPAHMERNGMSQYNHGRARAHRGGYRGSGYSSSRR